MIRKFLQKFFKNEISDIVRARVTEQEQRFKAERWKNQFAELDYLIGKPVIVLSNEWKDPIIGTLVRLEIFDHAFSTPWPVVFDELTQQEYLTFGSVCHYSEELVRAIEKLTPSEAWVLVTRGRCGAFVSPEEETISLLPRNILSRLPTGFGKE